MHLNQEHPLKYFFFLSNPFKTEVVIISLIKMLESPEFGHMTTPTISSTCPPAPVSSPEKAHPEQC